LNQDFIAVLTSHHSLKTKQSTPLLTGPKPRHPGNPPADMSSSKMAKWHERANYYAKYYLSLFRPEFIKSNLGYKWTDLQEFVDSLQHDNSIISKFRLMIMETHMQGLKTAENIKKMTLQYRGRQRDLWSTSQRIAYENYRIHNETQVSTNFHSLIDMNVLQELSQSTLNIMYKRLRHDSNQLLAIGREYTAIENNSSTSNSILQTMSHSELLLQYEAILDWRPSTAIKRKHGAGEANIPELTTKTPPKNLSKN
jgi:hypothetical protein